MKTKFLIVVLTVLLFAPRVHSQTIIIPVVYHVMYANAAQNVADSVLQEQLDVLNEDYNAMNTDLWKVPAVWQPIIGNMNVLFTLATIDPNGNPTTGIERQMFTGQYYNWNNAGAGGLPAWPDTSYLNIWVGNLTGPAGILAYAQFPGGPAATDGMVIDYRVIGLGAPANAPYDHGRTATHELAHWFGVMHINDYDSCYDHDGIADTPYQYGVNNVLGGYPVGKILTDSCQTSAPGIMWMNYLSYVNDTSMCFFTQGQIGQMIWCMNNMRVGFLTPDGVDAINEHPEISQYSVYPSPSTNGIFTISGGEASKSAVVEIYDLQGRIILSAINFENGSTSIQIDLSSFENGTYSVIIRTGSILETKRVVLAK